MLLQHETLEECPATGTMVVQWVRKVWALLWDFFKCFESGLFLFLLMFFFFVLSPVWQFPFFCSNREYIIGRRIWESGRTYYCVTKVRSKMDCKSVSAWVVFYKFITFTCLGLFFKFCLSKDEMNNMCHMTRGTCSIMLLFVLSWQLLMFRISFKKDFVFLSSYYGVWYSFF